MSELKAYSGEDIQDLIDNGDKIDLEYLNKQFVEKSEADKVIAELKAQVNGLHNRANLWHYNAQNEHNSYVEEHMKNAKLKYKLAEKDKQIEELKENHKKEVGQLLIEIVKLKEGAKNLILDNYLKDKEIHHRKYKQCIDNAWWCRKLRNVYALMAYTHRGWKIAGYYDEKAEFYRKWCERWLDLAEKFKEARL